MVSIHKNHFCFRSTTKEWVLFTGITAVRNKTLEWFLYTLITDVSEAQVWNGSYTHQSLMCTTMQWFLYTHTHTHTHTHQSLLLEAQLERQYRTPLKIDRRSTADIINDVRNGI